MSAPTLILTLKNDLSELARIAQEIEAYGESHGWPVKWILNLNISLDELITNIVSYGYQDCEEHEIRVTVSDRGGSLMVVLEDDGSAFNPFTSAPEPDLDASIEERKNRRLGRVLREDPHGRSNLRTGREPQSHHADSATCGVRATPGYPDAGP